MAESDPIVNELQAIKKSWGDVYDNYSPIDILNTLKAKSDQFDNCAKQLQKQQQVIGFVDILTTLWNAFDDDGVHNEAPETLTEPTEEEKTQLAREFIEWNNQQNNGKRNLPDALRSAIRGATMWKEAVLDKLDGTENPAAAANRLIRDAHLAKEYEPVVRAVASKLRDNPGDLSDLGSLTNEVEAALLFVTGVQRMLEQEDLEDFDSKFEAMRGKIESLVATANVEQPSRKTAPTEADRTSALFGLQLVQRGGTSVATSTDVSTEPSGAADTSGGSGTSSESRKVVWWSGREAPPEDWPTRFAGLFGVLPSTPTA